jgi:hypothetical protein
LSIDPALSEGETVGARPGEEAEAAWELGGGHWLSVARQRPEIDGGGFGRGKEKREQAELGQTAKREADRAAWVGWQVGRFREKVMESGGAAMEIRSKWDLGCQRKIEIVFANFWFKEMGFKSKVLNIFKPNLNCIQNRIKSNQLFENF